MTHLRKNFLSLILSFAIVLQPLGLSASASNSTATSAATSESIFTDKRNKDEFLQNLKTSYWGTVELNYPGLLEALQAPSDSSQELSWEVSTRTNLIDKDPFFIRSQKWIRAEVAAKNEGPIVFQKNSRAGLQIQLANSPFALQINVPLTPLLETADYILLVADHDDFFAQKLDGQPADDQGLFFINKSDFIAQSMSPPAMGLPIYFFPLPGRWAGVKVAFEWQMRQQYAVYDQEKNPLLIDISDIHRLEELGRMNLHLAQALTLLEVGPEFKGAILPQPNSTAYFGLFVSGQMQKGGSWAAWLSNQILPRATADSFNEPSPIKYTAPSRYERIKQKLKEFAMPGGITAANIGAVWYALANTNANAMIPPDMMHRLLVAGSVIAAAYVGAVVLKYTIYKTHFAHKYPHVEGESKFQSAWKEIKGHLDIFQHNTYAIDQTPALAVFKTTDLTIDRWFSKNKFLRQLYDHTLGWTNQSKSSIPVNWRATLFALADGHAASLSAAVSLLVFYPWLFSSMGMVVAAGGGALAAHFVSSEFIRIYFDHWRVGAQSYTSTLRISLRKEAEDEIARLLESQGLDPNTRASVKLKQDLIEEALNKKMISQGLPDKKDFMFDFNSLSSKWFDYFGISEEDLKKLNPDTLNKTQFVFDSGRWGLMLPSLKEGLKRAKEIYKQYPTTRGLNVIRTFEWAISRFGYTRALVREASIYDSNPTDFDASQKQRWQKFKANPANYLLNMSRNFVKKVSNSALESGRDIRRVLWLASTSSDPEDIYQLLPESWVNASGDKNAAYLATEILHYSVHSLHEKNRENLRPSLVDIRKFETEAHNFLRGHNYDSFEYRVRFDHKVIDIASETSERQRLINYNPLKLNFYELYQYKIGESAAEPYLQEGKEKVRFEFARAISQQMGLYLNNRENSELVSRTNDIANRSTENILNTPIETEFLKKINDRERTFYEAWIYTQEFLQTYISLTIKSDENFEVGSPERPGRLQIMRRSLVHAPGYKRFFLPCILSLEALFKNDASAYRVGLKGLFSRLPILPDVFESITRTLRVYPYTVTAGYAISVMFFQSTMTWPQSLLFSSLYSLTVLSTEITNRLVRNFGLQPMKNLSSRLMYTYILSWLISLRYIPVLGWGTQFDESMRANLINPVKNILSQATVHTTQVVNSSSAAIFESCARLLGGGQ